MPVLLINPNYLCRPRIQECRLYGPQPEGSGNIRWNVGNNLHNRISDLAKLSLACRIDAGLPGRKQNF